MTRTGKSPSNEKTDWDEALTRHREALRFYLDYLLQCECSQQILTQVEEEARERSVPDTFKLRFLLRTLVRNVIRHLQAGTNQTESSLCRAQDCSNSVADNPTLERLIYFMRDILEYSTRDTSLLIGITDAQVEYFLRFARKRIDLNEGPSSLDIRAPGWTYFRWKFEGLHLG